MLCFRRRRPPREYCKHVLDNCILNDYCQLNSQSRQYSTQIALVFVYHKTQLLVNVSLEKEMDIVTLSILKKVVHYHH